MIMLNDNTKCPSSTPNIHQGTNERKSSDKSSITYTRERVALDLDNIVLRRGPKMKQTWTRKSGKLHHNECTKRDTIHEAKKAADAHNNTRVLSTSDNSIKADVFKDIVALKRKNPGIKLDMQGGRTCLNHDDTPLCKTESQPEVIDLTMDDNMYPMSDRKCTRYKLRDRTYNLALPEEKAKAKSNSLCKNQQFNQTRYKLRERSSSHPASTEGKAKTKPKHIVQVSNHGRTGEILPSNIKGTKPTVQSAKGESDDLNLCSNKTGGDLQQQRDALIRRLECFVCLRHENSFHAFIPCGHKVCSSCIDRYNEDTPCPVCQVKIDGRLALFD